MPLLLNDGYEMILWSADGHILNSRDTEPKRTAWLADNLPPEGSVRCMAVTEIR